MGAQRLDSGALADEHVVLQRERHADGADERREPLRAAQRPVGEALDRPAVDRGEQHGDDQHQEKRQRHPGDAGAAEDREGDDGHERADHVNLAVGEVDHADDAVDHRVADGDQPVHAAERDAVDQLLEKVRHRASAPHLAQIRTRPQLAFETVAFGVLHARPPRRLTRAAMSGRRSLGILHRKLLHAFRSQRYRQAGHVRCVTSTGMEPKQAKAHAPQLQAATTLATKVWQPGPI